MAEGMGSSPIVQQAALLPAGLNAPSSIGDVPVVTWEQVADRFRDVAPAYWLGVLDEALRRYGDLASKPGSGDTYRQNNDELLTGAQIVSLWETGDRTFTWMGRNGGLEGSDLASDLRTGGWRGT
jgi:hypothetical protein